MVTMELNLVKKISLAALLCLGSTYIQATEAPSRHSKRYTSIQASNMHVIEYGTLRPPFTSVAQDVPFQISGQTYMARLTIPSDFIKNILEDTRTWGPLFNSVSFFCLIETVDNSENIDVFNVVQPPRETLVEIVAGEHSRLQDIKFGEKTFELIVNGLEARNANTKLILNFPKEILRSLTDSHNRVDIRMGILPRCIYDRMAGIQNPPPPPDGPTPTSAPQPNRNSKAS